VQDHAGLTAVHRRERQARETMRALSGIALADLPGMRVTGFLIAVWAAGCGGGGGGGGNEPDAPVNPPVDADLGGGDATDASQNPIDGSMPSVANDLCANATQISTATMHADVAATTTGAHAELAAPCGTAGAPDVFFKFTLSRRELVYADTFGATGAQALFFASSCTTARTASTTTGDALCSTGACGTAQSQVVAMLPPGTHYLVLAGQGATIHFRHVEVGAGTVLPLAQGSSSPTGSTSGFGSLYACEGGGAENSYWWRTCPGDAGGAFQASTCTGTDFDTILSLQMPGSDTVMCDDDTDGCGQFQSRVTANIPAGAGLYIISVDGFSQSKHGNYTLSASRP
jgi:hypothetical protein